VYKPTYNNILKLFSIIMLREFEDTYNNYTETIFNNHVEIIRGENRGDLTRMRQEPTHIRE